MSAPRRHIDLKHRAILMTFYSAGLRTAEAVHLRRPDHIDSGRMMIRIGGGRRRKDRYVMLSQQLPGLCAATGGRIGGPNGRDPPTELFPK